MKDNLQLIQLAITVATLAVNTFHDLILKVLSISPGTLPAKKSVLNKNADLALGWACCSLFILTAGHSIALAGKNPTASFIPVISLSVASVLLLYVVWLAWRSNRLERALWTLALASILILLLGPGGPFNPIELDRSGTFFGAPPSTPFEPPIPYWAALPILTTIFVASFIVDYPTILDIRKSPSTLVGLVFGIFSLSLCVGAGAALVQEVQNDPSTPPRLDDKSEQWVHAAREQLTPVELQDVYRKASELTLYRSYLTRFISTISELDQTARVDSSHAQSSASKQESGGNIDTEKGPDPALIRTRNQVRDLLGSSFLSPLSDKQEFLAVRLQWRYPISANGSKSGLPVPGTEPEQSILNLARLVQRYASAENEQNYGIAEQQSSSRQGASEQDPAEKLQADQRYHHAMREVFPAISTFPARQRLVQEMALPLNYESAIGFNLYQQTAVAMKGSTDVALRQATVPISYLQALYEVRERPNPSSTLSLLLDVYECEKYSSIEADLNQLTLYPVSFAEGLREVFQDQLDKDDSHLVDLFDHIRNTADNSTSSDSKDQLKTSASADAKNQPEAKRRDEALGRAQTFQSALKVCLASEQNATPLLSAGGQAGPAAQLLAPRVLSFVEYLSKQGGGKNREERTQKASDLLETLVNPIHVVWLQQNAVTNQPQSAPKIFALLMQFDSLSEEERRNSLKHLAAGLYSIGGPYSPSLIGSIVGEAGMVYGAGGTLSLALASVIVFPAFALAVYMGLVGGRVCLDRAMLLEQSDRTDLTSRSTSLPEAPTEFRGREDILLRLKAYARRGWNTVALTGPRGVGKSEILKRLIRDSGQSAIGLWLQAPTVFEETIFARAVQRRIAEAIEERISLYLELDTLAVRKLRAEAHGIAVRLFTWVSLASIALACYAYTNLRRMDVSAIWLPVGITLTFAFSALTSSAILLQRPDLGAWLKRSPRSNPHLELLYDHCFQEIFGMSPTISRRLRWMGILQTLVFAAIPISLLIVSASVWDLKLLTGVFGQEISIPVFWFEALAVVCLSIVFVGIYLYRRSHQPGPQRSEDVSWTGAIEEYRRFVGYCLDRMHAGAFGNGATQTLLIAIDELDRVTHADDLRTIIIRLRGLFEIKGAFYYLSMASDSLDTLLQGDLRSRTEVDSAFDHIERVSGLTYPNMTGVISSYLTSRSVQLGEQVISALALASFGIPRDAIRYCDQILAIAQEKAIDKLSLTEVARELGIAYPENPELSCLDERTKTLPSRGDLRRFLETMSFMIAENVDALSTKITGRIVEAGFATWENRLTTEQILSSVRTLHSTILNLSTFRVEVDI